MVTVFKLGGVLYLIYTRDHHPPHVHVKPSPTRAEWELRIYLGNVATAAQTAMAKPLAIPISFQAKSKLLK